MKREEVVIYEPDANYYLNHYQRRDAVQEPTSMSERLAPLTRNDADGNEYTLNDGACWITVNNLSVLIKRTGEGVVIDVYPLNDEMSNAIASTWALFADAEEDE